MTERAYSRLLDHVDSIRTHDLLYRGGRLSQATHDRIWSIISEGAVRPTIDQDFHQNARNAKAKLLDYVLSFGPFIFEEQTCLLIDVRDFNAEEWQWPRIPVIDVTDRAQVAFLTNRYLYPEKYIAEKVFLAVGLIAVLLWIFFLG